MRTSNTADTIYKAIVCIVIVCLVILLGLWYLLNEPAGTPRRLYQKAAQVKADPRDFGLDAFPAGYSATSAFSEGDEATTSVAKAARVTTWATLTSDAGGVQQTILLTKAANVTEYAVTPQSSYTYSGDQCTSAAVKRIALANGSVPVQVHTCNGPEGTTTSVQAQLVVQHPLATYTILSATRGRKLDEATFTAMVQSINRHTQAVAAPNRPIPPNSPVQWNTRYLRMLGLEELPPGFTPGRRLKAPLRTRDGTLFYFFPLAARNGHQPGRIRVTTGARPSSVIAALYPACADNESAYSVDSTKITRHERTCKPPLRATRHIDEFVFSYRGRYFTVTGIPANAYPLSPAEQKAQTERVVQWILAHAA